MALVKTNLIQEIKWIVILASFLALQIVHYLMLLRRHRVKWLDFVSIHYQFIICKEWEDSIHCMIQNINLYCLWYACIFILCKFCITPPLCPSISFNSKCCIFFTSWWYLCHYIFISFPVPDTKHFGHYALTITSASNAGTFPILVSSFY